MHRAILEACWPCAAALVGAFGGLLLLLRHCGANWQPARVRNLHRCETGGVQSLGFVLTVPAFMMIVLFIIQVSQLMVGTMVVNYAAFAAARSAIVWIPTCANCQIVNNLDYGGPEARDAGERQNVISGNVLEGAASGGAEVVILPAGGADPATSVKYRQILLAAVLACAPISPSRNLQRSALLPGWVTEAQDVTVALYPLLAPGTASNPRIPQRLRNKLAYSYQNTAVQIQWMAVPHAELDVEAGPSYNPRDHTNPNVPRGNPNEVGWQDPVTVTVEHAFALLPGPGRFLAARLVPGNGIPDKVSGTIRTDRQRYSETVYTTLITASATLTNDGIKSVLPHEQVR